MRLLLTSAGITNTSIRDAVYVGLSAGSMVTAPNIGEESVGWNPPTGGDRTLGVVDFRCFRTWISRDSRRIPWPTQKDGPPDVAARVCDFDDQTAIKVTDAAVEVVSEGRWKPFTP
jgi:dipeptidase E